MTTIVVNILRDRAELYVDKQLSVNGGRMSYLASKMYDYGRFKVTFTGWFVYLPPVPDLVEITTPQRLFARLSDWYCTYLTKFKEDRSATSSPLTIIALDTETGDVYTNSIGAQVPMKLELGVYAFGGGEEYAQGFFNAIQYASDNVEHHHVTEMYESISRLGYGTSQQFDHFKVSKC